MKKKKIIISIISIILIIIISITIWHIGINNKYKKYTKILNNDITKINEYLNKLYFYNNGLMEVTANYKGVHGESYPSNFTYNYEILDNTITFSDNGKYLDKNIDSNIINYIKKINNDIFKEKKVKYSFNKVNIIYDNNIFNKIFNTNYKTIKSVITNNIIIYLDNDYIEINDNIIKLKINNNDIKITLNDLKYSLNINDKLKVNAFLDENKYNIVLNGYAFTLTYDDNININMSSKAAIYNSINIVIKENNDGVIRNSKIENEEEIPMVRYLNNINREVFK